MQTSPQRKETVPDSSAISFSTLRCALVYWIRSYGSLMQAPLRLRPVGSIAQRALHPLRQVVGGAR